MKKSTKKKPVGIKRIGSSVLAKLADLWKRITSRTKSFLTRRPHRSFRLTRRRDYVRSLKIPGYWAFTLYVLGLLKSRWKLFLLVVLLYSIFSVIFGSMTSQGTYRQIAGLLEEGAPDALSGSWGTIGQAGILVAATFFGGTTSPTEVQQVYTGLIVVLTWLTTVWLLREMLASRKPKLRDGLYSSAAPLISTVLVFIYALIQLLPVGLLAVSFSALYSLGYITEGFGMFIFSVIAILVVALTLYWITSTFIALVVVTLPGMYPGQAIKIAGDLVVGRRLRIIYRLIWMLFIAALGWALIMIPVVLFDSWLSGRVDWAWMDWVPIVPFIATLLGSVTAVWMASYIYLLYRKVVDDDAAPA